ncbi:MAG: regulatory protein RecX [Flavobacteriales bacterium]
MDADTALKKCRALCARQERSKHELRLRLEAWDVPERNAEQVLLRLEKEDLLNEARFAEDFAVGHFRQKGWGKRMIQHALRSKELPERLITVGLDAIDDTEYRAALASLVRKRFRMERAPDKFIREQRVIRYLVGRGWEPDAVRLAIAGIPKR